MHTTTPLESVNYLTSNYWDNGCTVSPLHAFAHLLLKSGNTQLLTVDCWDFQTRPGTTKLLKAISDGQPSGADGKGNIIYRLHTNRIHSDSKTASMRTVTAPTERRIKICRCFYPSSSMPSGLYLRRRPIICLKNLEKWAQAMIDVGTWALR